MGGACSEHGEVKKCVQNFWFDILNGRDHSEDLGLYGKIIIKLVVGK
jgi:hypothetical protein